MENCQKFPATQDIIFFKKSGATAQYLMCLVIINISTVGILLALECDIGKNPLRKGLIFCFKLDMYYREYYEGTTMLNNSKV